MTSRNKHSPEAGDPPASEPGSSLGGLESLRRILLEPERAKIARLSERLDNKSTRAAELGEVLPEAISMRTSRDDAISRAVVPNVEQAINTSTRRDPSVLSEALYPVIAPAIRKAIAHALSAMVQSLNETLEHSLSARSLRWRWQAFRTGKSFAEVVLLNTLVYRVEQLFLIHRETGLLLVHAVADGLARPEAGMISGLLTAIQDFARDSFKTGSSEGLEKLQVGGLSVWIETGSRAFLAAVIRGTPPAEYRERMTEALTGIHREHGGLIGAFQGDPAPLEVCRPQVESCLVSKQQTSSRQDGRKRLVSPVSVGFAAIVLGFLIWGGLAWRERAAWNAYLTRLEETPGLLVLRAERRGGLYTLSGLRDPLASDPGELLKQFRLDPAKVTPRWLPQQSLDPEMILARAKSRLQPPPGVSIVLRQGGIAASGTAPLVWIRRFKEQAPALPGVDAMDSSGLVPGETLTFQELKRQIEETQFLFAKESVVLPPEQSATLRRTAEAIRELLGTCAASGQSCLIEITGFADTRGSDALNLRISRQRAEQVLRQLVSAGLPASHFKAVGAGASEGRSAAQDESERHQQRRVMFKVLLGAGISPHL